MTDSAGATHDDVAATRDGDEPIVNAYETRPGRTVFTEAENTEGWISTDLTVAAPR